MDTRGMFPSTCPSPREASLQVLFAMKPAPQSELANYYLHSRAVADTIKHRFLRPKSQRPGNNKAHPICIRVIRVGGLEETLRGIGLIEINDLPCPKCLYFPSTHDGFESKRRWDSCSADTRLLSSAAPDGHRTGNLSQGPWRW